MAYPRSLVAPLSRLTTCSTAPLRPEVSRSIAFPRQTIRCATTSSQTKKKKKASSTFKQHDLKYAEKFALVDAMHYIRAFEVGQNPLSRKYEMHIRLRSLKNGPVIRNRIRLPHPVKTDIRICIIAPPDSKAAADARANGAALVGEDEVFALIKEGKIEFDRCICHVDSLPKLNKSGVARLLGPKGLMPSVKLGTVVSDVKNTVRDMVGATEYRERGAVIQLAIGQLAFTPEQMQSNIKAAMEAIKKDIMQMSDRITKEIHEVVLSSTVAPGFTLSGDYIGVDSISPKLISGPL